MTIELSNIKNYSGNSHRTKRVYHIPEYTCSNGKISDPSELINRFVLRYRSRLYSSYNEDCGSKELIWTSPEACINFMSPIHIPTWTTLSRVESVAGRPKNNRSPGSNFPKFLCSSTRKPTLSCCEASRGKTPPCMKYTVLVNPLQSIAFEEVPPHKYGIPIILFAVAINPGPSN